MLTQENIAVAAIVVAAAAYLARLVVAKFRARRADDSCSGCGCGKSFPVTKPKGL